MSWSHHPSWEPAPSPFRGPSAGPGPVTQLFPDPSPGRFRPITRPGAITCPRGRPLAIPRPVYWPRPHYLSGDHQAIRPHTQPFPALSPVYRPSQCPGPVPRPVTRLEAVLASDFRQPTIPGPVVCQEAMVVLMNLPVPFSDPSCIRDSFSNMGFFARRRPLSFPDTSSLGSEMCPGWVIFPLPCAFCNGFHRRIFDSFISLCYIFSPSSRAWDDSGTCGRRSVFEYSCLAVSPWTFSSYGFLPASFTLSFT